ncbi:MAG: PEP-utilizing enzyme [Candidatus Woesearchaeota archaeon]
MAEKENKPTTLWIKQQTKELLDKFGNKGETYDDIINRLISQSKGIIPLKMNNLKLYRQGVEARPFFVSMPYNSALKRLGKKTSFAYYTGKKNYSYWDQHITTKIANEEIMKHIKDGAYIQKMISEWENLVEKQIETEKNLNAENLKQFDDDELIIKLKDFVKIIQKIWEIGIFIELFDPDSEGIILNILNRYDKTNLSQKEFQKLCTPLMLTNIQKEQISIYEITEKKDFEKIEEHARQYFWIKNTWADAVLLDKSYFRAKVARLMEENIDFKSEKEKHCKQLDELIKDKKKILCTRRLSVKIRRAVEFFEIMTEWREKRKKYAQISNHFLNMFAEEISKRFEVQKDLIMQADPMELKLPLSENFISKLKERSKICLQYADDDGTHFITGKIVEEFIKDIKEKTERPASRLYGNTANPGKAEGIAKIIFTTSDMHKMEKGDILVSPCTRPEYLPAMKLAKAIITDEGGITSHAAIVSRELGVPCIVGLRNATDLIKDDDFIEVNANHGVVNVVKKN